MRRLDPAQSAAAKGEGSIQLTLAGPGSGKTSTLTGRFVHLIRQGVDPARILAVTFTKKAADEMRRRIATLLELPSPSGLHVMDVSCLRISSAEEKSWHGWPFRGISALGYRRAKERLQLASNVVE